MLDRLNNYILKKYSNRINLNFLFPITSDLQVDAIAKNNNERTSKIHLDIGSGQSESQTGELKKKYNVKEYLRLDFDPSLRPDIIADAHHIPLKDNSIDSISSMAVFEHLKEPQIVANEMYRVLTKGGACVIGTHFMWAYHECPVDLWRYTNDGLKLIMEKAGFPEIHIDTESYHGYFYMMSLIPAFVRAKKHSLIFNLISYILMNIFLYMRRFDKYYNDEMLYSAIVIFGVKK